MKRLTKNLKTAVEENTTTTMKSGGNVETIKEGTPLDHIEKRIPGIVGISKGITKNMSNYESFRVDTWLSDSIKPGETELDAMQRLSTIIEEHLLWEVEQIVGEG